MPYFRKELYLLKDFDFRIIQPNRKNAEAQDKFLIVLDVVNNANGLYCLTTTLSGKVSSIVVPKLIDGCTPLEDAHFFKFEEHAISDKFTFDSQTYIKGMPSDIFEESIVTLYQNFNMEGKAENKGIIKDEIFISILDCLAQSTFLPRTTRARFKEISQEETKKLAAGSVTKALPTSLEKGASAKDSL